MQNKILFSVMLCLACTFSVNVSAQQDYYWYKESKILLERGNQEYIIYDDALLLQSDKEKIVETGDVSYPEMANLKWGITKPNAIIEDLEHVFYRTPSYKDTEGGNIYVTHCFYVKLKQEEDIVLLQNMTKQYNVDFEQDVDLPLWYILTCGLPSVFNALELANIFYETKLFAASEPEFIGAMSTKELFPTLAGLQRTSCTKTIGENEYGTVFGSRSTLIEAKQGLVIDGRQYLIFGHEQDRYLLREENNKILVYSSILKKDLVLYDFTLEVGDSLPALYFVWRAHNTLYPLLYNGDILDYNEGNGGTILPADTFVVTDISTITLLDGKEYKKWTFNNGMQYVEGIGSFGTSYAWNDFFQLIANVPQYSDAVSEHLVCVSKNGQLLYKMDDAEMERLNTECLCDVEKNWSNTLCDEWHVLHEPFWSFSPYSTIHFALTTDTTINARHYIKLESTEGKYTLYKGALREENKKVYFVPVGSNNEYLLYAFDVQKGEQLSNVWGGGREEICKNSFNAVVTDISDDTPRIFTLTLNTPEEEYYQIQWLEGVGFMDGPIGTQNICDIADYGVFRLLCAYRNGEQVYASDYSGKFGCEFNGFYYDYNEDVDTIPLYTGDDPGSSTIDPIDPNQVVVTLNGNELNIKESSGDEINYTLVLNKNKQAPAKEQTVQDNSFVHSVSIELTESGYYTLRLTNPKWTNNIVGHFQYINSAIEEVQGDEKCNAKILRDGQLLIRVGERLYTPTGMQIQ